MKIYFIAYRYFRGIITISKQLTDKLKNENPDFEVFETDLKRVNFIPCGATLMTMSGSGKKEITESFINGITEYFYFETVYSQRDEGENWFQAVHEGYLPDLEKGIDAWDFSIPFSGHSLYLRKSN